MTVSDDAPPEQTQLNWHQNKSQSILLPALLAIIGLVAVFAVHECHHLSALSTDITEGLLGGVEAFSLFAIFRKRKNEKKQQALDALNRLAKERVNESNAPLVQEAKKIFLSEEIAFTENMGHPSIKKHCHNDKRFYFVRTSDEDDEKPLGFFFKTPDHTVAISVPAFTYTSVELKDCLADQGMYDIVTCRFIGFMSKCMDINSEIQKTVVGGLPAYIFPNLEEKEFEQLLETAWEKYHNEFEIAFSSNYCKQV